MKLKLQLELDGFKSPVPANVIATEQSPSPFGLTVTRGPRESSSVNSETVHTFGVEVVNEIPFNHVDVRPSVELTFASKNAPDTGTAFGAITLTRVACLKNEMLCETGVAARN